MMLSYGIGAATCALLVRLLFRSRTRRLFTPAYRRLVKRSPHLRPRLLSSVWLWFPVGVASSIIFLQGWADFLFERHVLPLL